MGYAKLSFTTSVSSSQLLSDIFKVITGTITSASQLEYCLTGSSEVVNSLGENWAPVVSGSLEVAVSASCVTASKNKYVILRSVTGTTNTATGSNLLIAGTGTTTAGIIMNGASFVVSGSANVVATNPTYYNTNTTAATLNAARFGVNTNGDTQIHLSWSNRHLLIYGGTQGSAATMINACFEFPENNLTTYNNSAPFMMVRSSMLSTTMATSGGPTNDSGGTFLSLVTLNQYRPSYTSPVTSGVNAFSNATGNGTLYGTLSTNASALATSINAANQAASYFVPLWFAEPAAGLPIMNASTLTNVFTTTANIGTTGDTVIVGPYTYVTLMLGTTMYGGTKYSAVMVPKF